jgi:hypothetical protein
MYVKGKKNEGKAKPAKKNEGKAKPDNIILSHAC